VKAQGLQLVLTGDRGQARFDLVRPHPVRIGRDPASTLVLCDPSVSRGHAEIEMETGRLVLHDLGSKNGTFLNGSRVAHAVLFPGDRIRFAESAFSIHFESTDWLALDELDGDEADGAWGGPGLWGRGTRVLAGVVGDLSIVDLVQVLAASGKTGTLLLFNGRMGRIDLRSGEISFAQVDAVSGEKAFFRLLNWRRAEFEFHPEPPTTSGIDTPTDVLLLEAIQQREEVDELRPRLPAPGTVLAVDLSARASLDREHLDPIERDVLDLALKHKTLAGILRGSDHFDLDLYAATLSLIERGLLVDTHAEQASERVTLEFSLSEILSAAATA
jgi:hypothetical protein